MITTPQLYDTNSQMAIFRNIENERKQKSNYYFPKTYVFESSNSEISISNSALLNEAELFKFLITNDIFDIYQQTIKRIHSFFPYCDIKKELFNDFDDNTTKLFLIVKTKLSTEAAFYQLVAMRKDWIIAKNNAFINLISITSETNEF